MMMCIEANSRKSIYWNGTIVAALFRSEHYVNNNRLFGEHLHSEWFPVASLCSLFIFIYANFRALEIVSEYFTRRFTFSHAISFLVTLRYSNRTWIRFSLEHNKRQHFQFHRDQNGYENVSLSLHIRTF